MTDPGFSTHNLAPKKDIQHHFAQHIKESPP